MAIALPGSIIQAMGQDLTVSHITQKLSLCGAPTVRWEPFSVRDIRRGDERMNRKLLDSPNAYMTRLPGKVDDTAYLELYER
jgi:hypothetical protein